MQTFIGIIIAILIFGLLVLIHEFGHFIFAKKFGVTVNEFSIGMGPRIFSRVAKSGTRYSIKALPIGGSCAMLGEDEDNDEEGSFNSKPRWQRFLIVFAGPLFNFLLAFVLSLIVIGFAGTDPSTVTYVEGEKPNVITQSKGKEKSVEEKMKQQAVKNAVLQIQSNAYKAGLRSGDKITKFNGAWISIGRELYVEEYTDPIDKEPITLTYERDGKKKTITYKPDKENKYLLGISYSSGASAPVISQVTKDSAMAKAGVLAKDEVEKINGTPISSGEEINKYLEEHPLDGSEVTFVLKRGSKTFTAKVKPVKTNVYSTGFTYNLQRERQGFFGTIKYSLVEMRYEVFTVLKSLKMLVTGGVSANEVSGPVGIVSVIGDTYKENSQHGFGITLLALLNLAIMLSANLGVMNLLPIPALDGGRLLIYIIEAITRKQIPKDKEGMIHFIGFIILMALMVFLVFNDVRKLIM
ncbi:MAG TPA: RIP metalloprotease RseP [Eubacterium sp.]|nr:RIP metalloprotease RseP [Eubacterium sp.]